MHRNVRNGLLAIAAVGAYCVSTPTDLGGPFSAHISKKHRGSISPIELEGAKIQEHISDSKSTVGLQIPHSNDTSEPITAHFKPNGGKHVLIIAADAPGYLVNIFDNVCKPNTAAKVTQSPGLGLLLQVMGHNPDDAIKTQESYEASDANKIGSWGHRPFELWGHRPFETVYKNSAISGEHLIKALGDKNLPVEIASKRNYVVHAYRFSCNEDNNRESNVTNYAVIAPINLAHHRMYHGLEH